MDKNDGAASLVRSDALLADLVIVEELARKAPELNPSNYDHEEVCRLNAAMCELYEVVRKYRPADNAAPHTGAVAPSVQALVGGFELRIG